MNSRIIAILVAVLMVACNNPTEPVNADDTAPVMTNKVKSGEFSNPLLIYGSSFGSFFQALYKQGKFEDMLKFTSAGTIDKFGRERILALYKKMDFAYGIGLGSKSTVGDTIILNYEAGIMATSNMVRIKVVVENDSSKIVLDNLRQFHQR